MKKIFLIVLLISLLFSLCACKNISDKDTEKESEDVSQSQVITSTTVETTFSQEEYEVIGFVRPYIELYAEVSFAGATRDMYDVNIVTHSVEKQDENKFKVNGEVTVNIYDYDVIETANYYMIVERDPENGEFTCTDLNVDDFK